MTFIETEVYENKSDEWATPKSFYRPLREAVNGFDLDPASGAEDEPIATEQYTKEDDGLSQKWFGTVFVNPPFSDKDKWIDKAINEVNKSRAETIVMLLPVDTSTKWFHKISEEATVFCFIGPGRMDFERDRQPGGKDKRPNFAVMTVVFGKIPSEKLLKFLNTRGIVVWNDDVYRETFQQKL